MTNQGIVVQRPKLALQASLPIPTLRDDYILVKVHSVALNPTDWKHVDFLSSRGALVGCDYSGTVVEVGSAVTKPFKKGDRVSGFAHGCNEVNHEDGTFAKYIVAKGDLQIQIPSNLSFEEAATLGVGVSTVGQGLYQSLKLPLPNASTSGMEAKVLLIYGGSTATGALAIQFAKLSGMTVVTTCSPRNFEYVKALGADAIFDYRSETCAEDIKKAYTDITLVFDCISEGSSPKICVTAMSASGGKYSTLLPVSGDDVAKLNPKVEVKLTLAYTIIGEDFMFGAKSMAASHDDFVFGKTWWELVRTLLEDEKIKVHKPIVNKYGEGFSGVLKGMNAMREGKISAEKLVFNL